MGINILDYFCVCFFQAYEMENVSKLDVKPGDVNFKMVKVEISQRIVENIFSS